MFQSDQSSRCQDAVCSKHEIAFHVNAIFDIVTVCQYYDGQVLSTPLEEDERVSEVLHSLPSTKIPLS